MSIYTEYLKRDKLEDIEYIISSNKILISSFSTIYFSHYVSPFIDLKDINEVVSAIIAETKRNPKVKVKNISKLIKSIDDAYNGYVNHYNKIIKTHNKMCDLVEEIKAVGLRYGTADDKLLNRLNIMHRNLYPIGNRCKDYDYIIRIAIRIKDIQNDLIWLDKDSTYTYKFN